MKARRVSDILADLTGEQVDRVTSGLEAFVRFAARGSAPVPRLKPEEWDIVERLVDAPDDMTCDDVLHSLAMRGSREMRA